MSKDIIDDIVKRIREAKTEDEAKRILLANTNLINSRKDPFYNPFDEFYAELQEKEKSKKDMLIKPDYINWIIKYTEKRNQFYDDDFNITKVDDYDKTQMKKLSTFVGLISDYANDNDIESIQNEFGVSYRIKYKDTGLEVGVMHGNGSCCYAQRIPIEEGYIDFSKVMTKVGAKLHAENFMARLNNDEFEKDIDPNPGEPFIPTKENIDREVENFKKVLDSDLFKKVVGDKPKTLTLEPKKED